MTNKEIIRKVNEGFSEGNNEKILLYVADDVRWEIINISTHVGKEAFAKEINNENFVGVPIIKIKNEIEEGDKVAVEGEVQCMKTDGTKFDAFFFDWYLLQNGLIKEMHSYLVEKSKT